MLSGSIALIYLIGAYFTGGPDTMVMVGIFLILPLACIWFSDAMGDYTGAGSGHGAITSTTPGCLVAFGGWLLLFILLIIAGLQAFSGKD